MTDLNSINSALALPTADDPEWKAVADALLAEISPTEFPDKVLRATEYLLTGWPTYKVAKKLGVSPTTITGWMHQYPAMAAVIARGRSMLSSWRMAKLEQQFILAMERSQEILELPLDGELEDGTRVNPKILPVIAAQARYIIGLFAGQHVDVKVTHEVGDTVLKAKQDALNYLASQLDEQRKSDEPLEAVYRVVDEHKFQNHVPLIDEEGNPPFGEYGVLDAAENGTLCHACGKRFSDLYTHTATKHGLTEQEYNGLYMIDAES